MVETVTANYGWTKPEISHSPSTWGVFLNSDLDSIDALVFANQQGIVPIGSITMFGGATAPANWLICNGQSLDTTVYAALFSAFGGATGGGYRYGGSGASFNLPNLQGIFPLGAGPSNALASTGGAATVTLDPTMMPAHTHTFTGAGHIHNITDPGHAHTDAGHTHQYSTVVGGSGIATGSNFQLGLVQTGSASANIQTNKTGITATQTASAVGTNSSTGGGLPHPNIPPYLAINFIIRVI